jgi:small-conductance mechanosensitive channel
MNDLLQEIGGWLGYLQRPVVLMQLLGVSTALLAYGVAHRWPGLTNRRHRQGAQLLLVAILALFGAGLELLELPNRLVVVALLLLGGWFALEAGRLVLRRWLPARLVQQLDTGLMRPLYVLLTLLVLLAEVDSPGNLALIPLGEWFGSAVSLGQLVISLLVIYLLLVATGPPSQALAWLLQRLIGISDAGRRALALLLRYAAVTLGVLWTLEQIGINHTAILAVAGGLSVGLGFGIKEVFSNFVSGLWLLFEGSVRPGDVLYIDGDPCEVRSLGLRAAVLWRDRDNAELVIPNQTFFTTPTTTYTGSDRLRRSQVVVGAAYHHDPSTVIQLLEHTAAGVAGVLPQPAPRAFLLRYGESSIDYSLRFWIADPLHNLGIASAVQVAVWQAFQQHAIEIPFPQRVLHQATDAGTDVAT